MEILKLGGLPLYSLYIKQKDLRALNRDIWSDEPVPALFHYEDKKYKIDILYRGAHTRKLKKKSYEVEFFKPRSFFGSHELHLNAEYHDPSLMRNKLSLDLFQRIGCLAPNTTPIFLNLNETPAGIYLQLESVDYFFLSNRNLPPGGIYYADNDDANFSLLDPDTNKPKKRLDSGYLKKYGNEEDDRALLLFLYKIVSVPQVDFSQEISTHLNINQYLRWLACVVFTQNFDGFIHNYDLYRNNGLFEMIPWDYDATWGRDVNGIDMPYDYVPIEGYNTLTARILSVPTFRKQYKDLLEELLETHFTLSSLEPYVTDLHGLLSPYLTLDPFKKAGKEEFEKEPEFILQFIQDRNKYLKDKLKTLN